MTHIHTQLRRTTLIGLASLSGAVATAQTITPLVMDGDVLPNGTVNEIFNVDVNNDGEWLAEVRTDNSTYTMGDAVLLNGTVIHLEGTNLGLPASHAATWVYDGYVDSMDVNDNGDILMHMHVDDPTGTLVDRELVLWTSGEAGTTHVLIEEGVTPCLVSGEPSGAVWSSIEEVWQNNNDELVVIGKSDTDWDNLQVVMTHDGAGNLTGQTVFAMTGVVHSTAFPAADGVHADTVETLGIRKQNMAFNDNGQKLFFIDDQTTGSGGSPDYSAVDSHYYIDDTELVWEADDAPTPGNFAHDHLSIAEVDMNDFGSWVAVWGDTNPDDTQDYFIVVDGELFQQEGQAPPGIDGGFVMTGYSWGRVQISNSGDIFWYCEWNDPDTSKNSALWRNSEILIREGQAIGGLTVDRIQSAADYMAASDNGRFVIQVLKMNGYVDGAYLVEIEVAESYCFGDGSGWICPCANPGGSEEGCANSTGSGATLWAGGSLSVTHDDLFLSAEGLPPGELGLFFMGTTQRNGGLGVIFGDGQLCVGGALQRLQVATADAQGSITSTIPIASSFGVVPGDTRYFQVWYQDASGPCAGQFNTSNALSGLWY